MIRSFRTTLFPVLLAVVLAGCKGVVKLGTGDGGGGQPDGSSGIDASVDDDGALPPDGTLPPDGATSPDSALPDAAPTDCTVTGCQDNAYCDSQTLTCECLTGFQDDGQGNCVAIDPGDPAARTENEVCSRWTSDHQHTASTVWTAGAQQCDLGTLSAEAIADAVAFVNVYRYLCGLQPLSDDAQLNENAQYCAIIQYRQGFLSHSPDPSAPCYTTQGANASGSSNLALGDSNPASAVDRFMDDSGVSSLGHRRWIINPSYGPAGVGFAGSATCLYVFSWTNSGNPDFVAWPNQGFTPRSVMPSVWSFSTAHYTISSQTEVAIKRVSDQADLNVSYNTLASGYGQPAIGFSPSGWMPQAGETYEVTVSNLGGGQQVVYQVKPTNCP